MHNQLSSRNSSKTKLGTELKSGVGAPEAKAHARCAKLACLVCSHEERLLYRLGLLVFEFFPDPPIHPSTPPEGGFLAFLGLSA